MKINGKPVHDATKPLTIKITSRDCKIGGNRDPGSCAAARAVLREVTKAVAARIHIARAYIQSENGNWTRYLTSGALRTEIIAFDRGGSFEPGTYILNPIPKYARLGVSNAKKPAKKKTRSSELRSGRQVHIARNVRPRGANR